MKIDSVLKPKHMVWASGAVLAGLLLIVLTRSGAKASVQADILLLDISLGDLSGFDVARRLGDRPSRTKIIFLSIHEDIEFVAAGFDTGAYGYIFKSRVVEDLRQAIEIVYAGGRFVSPTSRFVP
jgi:DNA-binding NarL/FixJ family response regulator